jgi:hypothetical protein
MDCVLCKKPVVAGTKAVELAGGFFDHDAPPFFVVDDSVLAVSYLHFQCLETALREKMARG